MKLNDVAKNLVSALCCPRIVDQSAETILDLQAAWKIPERSTLRHVKMLMAAGTIEQVWKTVPNCRRLVPAYRMVKPRKKPASSAAAA